MTTSNEHNNAPAVPVAWTVAGEITNWSRDFSMYRTQYYVRPVYATPAPAPAITYDQWQQHEYTKVLQDRIKELSEKLAIYTQAPAPAQEVGLTDEEIEAIAKKHMSTVGDHWCNEEAIRERHAEDFARAIIAALRAKGQS